MFTVISCFNHVSSIFRRLDLLTFKMIIQINFVFSYFFLPFCIEHTNM